MYKLETVDSDSTIRASGRVEEVVVVGLCCPVLMQASDGRSGACESYCVRAISVTVLSGSPGLSVISLKASTGMT